MTKILFAGSRTDCVTQVAGYLGEINDINGGNSVDLTYCDAGLDLQNTAASAQGFFTDPAAAPLLAPYAVQAGASVYFHASLAVSAASAYYDDYQAICLLDSANGQWVRVMARGQVQYNSGTAAAPVWSNIGTPYAYIGQFSTPIDLDLKVDIAANGIHTVLFAQSRVAQVGPLTFEQPLMTNIASFTISGDPSNRAQDSWSQLLCTENLSTVGCHVATVRPIGPGVHSDWIGSYTDVNEVFTNDTTVNQANTAGLQQSYPMSNITIPDGYIISGVFQWMRVKNAGSAPTNISALLRTATNVDHITPPLNGILPTFKGVGARYDVNPDTGQLWTQADWNSNIQLGFVSED